MVNLGASDNFLLVGSCAECDDYTGVRRGGANAEMYSVIRILRKTVFFMWVQSEKG